MNETTPSLEEVVAALGTKANRRGHRQFSTEAKAKACRFALEAIANGASKSAVSTQLGLSEWTLPRWIRNARRKMKAEAETPTPASAPVPAPRFHRVMVSDLPKATATAPTVFGPMGIRIEGLSVDAMAELLRRLWCSA